MKQTIIGFDTGFFPELLKGNNKVIEIWQKLLEDDSDIKSYVSCLTFFELKKLSLKGVIIKDYIDKLIVNINLACSIIYIDNTDILIEAAKIYHGTGIPAFDSIILHSLVSAGCETIYTTDKDFEKYKNKKIKIINVKKI